MVEGQRKMSHEFDPFDHRPESQKITSTIATFALLLNGSIGAALLMLPYAFKTSGYVAALLCSGLMSLVMIHTMVLMIKCSHKLSKRAKVPSLDFSGTVETAFSLGPRPLRGWATWVGKFITVLLCLEIYQTIVVYAIYVATLIKHAVDPAEASDDLQRYLIILVPFFFMMSLVPDFRVLTWFSMSGFAFLVIAIVCSFYYFLKDPYPIANLDKFTSLEGVSSFCAIIVFNLDISTTIMPLENNMKSPKRMALVIWFATALSAIIFVGFGFFGYKKYMNPCDTVIRNLPMNSPVSLFVTVLTAVSVLFNYGLQSLILTTIMWPIVSNWLKVKSSLSRSAFCTVGVLLSTSQAVLFPSMVPVVEVVSGVMISTFVFLMPIVVETLTIWEESTRTKFIWISLKNFAILVIFVFILVIATVQNVTAIIDEFLHSHEEENCLANSTMASFVDL